MEVSISVAARVLLPIAKAVAPKIEQLRAERRAAQDPFGVQSGPGNLVLVHLDHRAMTQEPFRVRWDLLGQNLKETLELRFLGGNFDDAWWRRVLASLEQDYVVPKFFKMPTVQSWLGEEDVQEGIVSLARANLMGQLAEGENETRKRLSENYSKHTGEPEHFAKNPIDVVVAVLTAGYIASIPRNQQAVAGMVQASHGHLDRRLEGLERKLDSTLERDPVVQSVHAKVAEDELSTILTLRMFALDDAIERVGNLCHRVNVGDLQAVPEPVKTRVRYWATRLRLPKLEAVDEARSIRQGLSHSDTNENMYVLDALIRAADDDVDGAIRILREDDDPDSRSVLLGLLMRYRSEEEALEWCGNLRPEKNPTFFTAVGWQDWAVCLGKAGKWREAADGLKAVASTSDWGPDLAMIEGVVNAALLIPGEYRELVFEGLPAYTGMAPNLRENASARHERARVCFGHASRYLSDIARHDLTRFLAEWRIWVDLMDPDAARADLARRNVRDRLERGDLSPELASLSMAFNIEFDTQKVRLHLNKKERYGGLLDEDLLAELLLNRRSMSPREFATYVEGRLQRFDKVMSKLMTTMILFEALLESKQVERARAMIEKRRHLVDAEHAARMEAVLDEQTGVDPRKRLEALFRESGELCDLKNIIGHLTEVDDRDARLALLKDLFDREPKLEHAIELIRCLSHPVMDHVAILEFLESHPKVAKESDDMKSALAWSLFSVGRIKEAIQINNKLLATRRRRNDLMLDVKIAVATGAWEKLTGIVEREWQNHGEHEAESLIVLARLASQTGYSSERAVELARLAAQKAPTDPHVLIAAYGIYIEIGRDVDANPEWLSQALANSTEEGPIWQTDFQQMVNDWLPRMRERSERIYRMLMGGKVALAVAGEVLNTPLSRVLLASESENVRDGRGRAVVPIISATRPRIDLGAGWTIGVDLTSIMVLSRIGLLETTLDALEHVKLAPGALGCLLADRADVRFHQPARVKAAREVLRLIKRRQITLVDRPSFPSPSLAEEVGEELATLLEARAGAQGVVVGVRPIHKPASLMGEIADTTAHDEFILSPADLCLLAHRAGLTDAGQDERAKIFLASQDQTAGEGLSQSSLDGPIFVHSVALSYLQYSQVLAAIANGGLDLRIHSTVADEMNGLIEAGDSGEELAEAVEGIRDTLRAGMESGKVTLLPLPPERRQKERAVVGVDSLAALLFGGAECDAICIDDRFVNSRVSIEGPTGKSVPVVCVLDVLRYLRARRVISAEQYWGSRHKLRQAGFAFIPVEAEELLNHLLAAECKDGRMLESAELRVIRQTVNRVDSADLLSGSEARALGDQLALACREVIIERLWSNNGLEAADAGALCSWVWRHLSMTAFLPRQGLEGKDGAEALREGFLRRLSLLLVPPIVDSSDRRSAYRDWLNQAVLDPLRLTNGDVVEDAANAIRLMIKGSGDHVGVVGRLFLKCMSGAMREHIVNEDPAFGEQCGFSSAQFIVVDRSLRIAVSDVLDAAGTVDAGTEIAPLTDIGGKPARVARAGDGETLVVSWADSQGKTRRVQIPELTLVSENAEFRTRALHELVGELGPTAKETSALLEHVSSRRLTKQEVSEVFKERVNGVAAVQSRLAGRIAQDWQTSLADLVPPSRTYWERFCGPIPDDLDAETYFLDQLIPYRKGLIEVDLRAGLDIACLGALRDDLSPGSWLVGIDDDTVWNALKSVPAKGNPIALLAVLDVALYRAGDDRFRRLAEHTIEMLLDDHLSLPKNCDVYQFLAVLADFEMDHLSLVEGANRHSGFWRRMCAWMQAGLIVRTAVGCGALPEVGSYEDWFKRHAVQVGKLRRLADYRAEPMVLGHMPTARYLRDEVHVRLRSLQERHGKAGRDLPKAAEIEAAQSRMGSKRSVLAPAVPGPAALHLRPHEPIPNGLADSVANAWTVEGTAEARARTAYLSQAFVLRDSQLAKVGEALQSIADQTENDDFCSVFDQLHAASIIAAAARDTELANSVGADVSTFASRMSRPDDLDLALRVLFQAAAAHADESEWKNWLATQLADVAERLPLEASDCKLGLSNVLDSLAVVLPIRSWVHLPAKQIAEVALEAAP